MRRVNVLGAGLLGAALLLGARAGSGGGPAPKAAARLAFWPAIH